MILLLWMSVCICISGIEPPYLFFFSLYSMKQFVQIMMKGKYRSTDNTNNGKRKGKLIKKMRSPEERHAQTQGNLIEIF